MLLIVELNASEEETNPLPFDYMNVQFAGQIGFLSVAGGNTFLNDHYDFEIYIGATPRFLDISEVTIYTLAIKNNYVPYTFNWSDYTLRPYIGLGFLIGNNQRYNPNWQDNIDKGYYYQNIWHVTGNMGLLFKKKLEGSSISSLGFYVETVTLDVYVIDYFQNTDALDLDDIFSLSFGARIEF